MKHRAFRFSKPFVVFILVALTCGLVAVVALEGNASHSLASGTPNDIYLPLVMLDAGMPTAVIPETTEILTDPTTQYLSSISEDGTVFTFSQTTPELDDVSPGDVIVGDITTNAPYGFLRKVTTVSSVGSQVIVETEDATLEDAIQDGGIRLSQTLTPDDIQETMQVTGVTLATASQPQGIGTFYFTLDNVVLYDDDGDPGTTNDQITANGSITLEPSFDFGMVIRWFHLEELNFTITATETAEIQIEADLEYPLIQQEKEIARHYFTPITVLVGPFPIVIVPVLTINVGVDGSVHVGIATGVTQQATLTAGLQYDDSVWSTVKDFENEFQFIPPVLSAGLDLKGYAGVQLSLMLYGVVGPHAEINAYLKLEADIFATPWWQLYGGLEVQGGIKIEIYSRSIAGYEATLIDYRIMLAQAETATPTPTHITFLKHTIDYAFDGAISVYATDVDGDGDVDVLGIADLADDIAWWENDGSQNFTKYTIDGSFSGASSVYAIDVDGDGDVDVLGAAELADDIAWWENDGSENFSKHIVDGEFNGAISVYATDVDGDGDVDVLGAARLAHDIAWWENDGSQNFTKYTIEGTFNGAWSVYATDVDGDGDVDVLGAAREGGWIAWWENDGNENFAYYTIDGERYFPSSVYAIDVDGDGDVDVLGAAFNDHDIAWYENDGNENFTKYTIDGEFVYASSVYAIDVDGDGDVDVLGAAAYAHDIAWWENDGSENFSKHIVDGEFDGAMSVYATDVDGDGDVDVLGAAREVGEIAWWEQLP